MKSFAVTWDRGEMASYRKQNSAAILPDTILLGVAIGNVHNPSLSVLLEKLESMSQSIENLSAQQSVQLTASGVGMRARFGNWLVRLGNQIAGNGGN